MDKYITHLCAPVRGGVSDYVDVCLSYGSGERKLTLEKQFDSHTRLSGNCLLHFSGYGYAQRGAPMWLLHKIRMEREKMDLFGVFFHELYAFGPPWTSAFWLSPVQRHIARSLAEISDFWITNREGSAQWLRRFAGDRPHAVLPVFSNAGELPAYSSNRAQKIVVFGGAALRLATYRAAGEDLFVWARSQGLQLHDIGPCIDDPVVSALLQNAGAIQHGRLEPVEVSRQLEVAAYGIVAYPAGYVAKSGVFAAYCAHGVCPILISSQYGLSDGLVAGQHYLAAVPKERVQENVRDAVGRAAWEWYRPHRIESHMSAQRHFSQRANKRGE